jgi:SepF-like predicted cell division protein (DUF552 family)
MPYRIQWYVEGRVILEEAFGDVTIEELVRFNAEVTALIVNEGIAPVHVIVDLSKVEKYPSSLREVLGTMRQKNPEKVGWMMIVTESPVMRFVASTVFQLARLKLRTFATMQQAKMFLAEIDESVAMIG